MRIALTGATGQLGRLVLEQLKTRVPATQIVALVRNLAKAEDLGVETRLADYNQPETLPGALAGVGTLLLISSSEVGQRTVQHRNVLEAAKQAGVQRVVYTSVLRADTSPLSLAVEHRATEADLKASELPFTILRNGWYTENHTAAILGTLATGAIYGSAGEGRFSPATRADFAEATARVLTEEGHVGQTYELAGDESYTLAELAAEISRQTGKTIPYHDLPMADYAAVLVKVGLPEGLAHAIASWDADAAAGALFDDGHQLSHLLGRPTTSLATAVGAALN
ncbi:SDR family oxidoreductase [Hymenobacter sp. B1770]|uniref:SDR family oxidoreductase n=1 Tax=Hymenobacter sp. B1770 TaxID=1718788 RepID=UPI003CF522F1